jgi:hypothetical protein
MYTLNYEFSPGMTVFLVIDGSRVEEGVVLSIKFDVITPNTPILEYSVLLSDVDDGTVLSVPELVFGTLQEASNKVIETITPTVT